MNHLISYMFDAGWRLASTHPLRDEDRGAWLVLGFREESMDDDWYLPDHFENPCDFCFALRWQLEKDGYL